MRYTLNISFFNSFKTIVERCKSMQEAMSYESMLDDTVKAACIIDNITGKIVVWLKRLPY